MYLQPLGGASAPITVAHMRNARRGYDIQKRQQNMSRNTFWIGLAFLIVVALAIFIFLGWRTCKLENKGKKKKKATWFGFGSSGGSYEQANSLNDMDGPVSGQRRHTTVRFVPGASGGTTNSAGTTTVAGIDRNTSVRSVMTLPPYRPDAGDTERVLGREGERDGVDTVVELQTAEEEEEMRENEMAALYELRLARREQIQEREQRRQERRDARARGDNAALRAIQERTRIASGSSVLEERRAEHERLKAERQRAVSSVSYGDLGVARHDGTRIRATSVESERVGLLSDAASIAATSTHSGHRSPQHQHHRHASQASILTLDSDTSRPHTPYLNTNVSSPDLAEDTPAHSPPGYDDVSLNDDRPGSAATSTAPNEPPPDYPGPAQQGASRIAAEMSTAAAAERSGSNTDGSDRGSPQRSPSGPPRLPELQITSLPTIVVEPSSARP